MRGKYIIDGELESPEGKKSMVRMIWIVDRGQGEPRLVTVYPLKLKALRGFTFRLKTAIIYQRLEGVAKRLRERPKASSPVAFFGMGDRMILCCIDEPATPDTRGSVPQVSQFAFKAANDLILLSISPVSSSSSSIGVRIIDGHV
ncbi:MAG: hypothetical protein M1339_02975 [Bacteroidetes bacterium]|nr:hypothetical protein [Bacteroidota bacterium]